MAWGYSTHRVSKVTRASVDTRGPKGNKPLFVLLFILASIFVFSIATEILGRPQRSNQREMQIRINDEAETEPELLVDPNGEWEKGDKIVERKFRVLWKKPEIEKKESDLWVEKYPTERIQEKKPVESEEPWDGIPSKTKKKAVLGW